MGDEGVFLLLAVGNSIMLDFFSQQKGIPSVKIITMTSKHETADQRPQEDCCRMMNCRINSVEGPLWGEVGITKWMLLGTIIARLIQEKMQ